MDVRIRESTQNDIEKMLSIFDEARESIARLGIDQWQNGYPHRAVIESDIEMGYSRVATMDGEVVSTFAIIDDGEPTYDEIFDGKWLTGDEKDHYFAIHRVAISVKSRGSGISTQIIDFCAEKARENGKSSLRIDTHRGNVVMRRMLEKNGFVYCGVIYLSDGDERVAYELKFV